VGGDARHDDGLVRDPANLAPVASSSASSACSRTQTTRSFSSEGLASPRSPSSRACESPGEPGSQSLTTTVYDDWARSTGRTILAGSRRSQPCQASCDAGALRVGMLTPLIRPRRARIRATGTSASALRTSGAALTAHCRRSRRSGRRACQDEHGEDVRRIE